jgi:glucose/arabinose dehydrogenase
MTLISQELSRVACHADPDIIGNLLESSSNTNRENRRGMKMQIRRFAITAISLTLASPLLSPGRAMAQDPAAKDWSDDSPGVTHRIDVGALPEPFATPSGRNFPTVVDKPAGAELSVPAGFRVSVFTSDVQGPRVMRIAPNGDIFLAETQSGRIKVLRPTADHSGVASSGIFAEGLDRPFGMQFYPAGGRPEWLYVAENNRVIRYPYGAGSMSTSAEPEVIVSQLAPTGNGHYTRDLVFSADGERMFVSVGSLSNVAEDMPKKSPAEIQAWEAEHGLGAAWGDETNRADVLVFDVGSEDSGHPFATGIRNCVGLTLQPGTGDVWCTVNERDGLGDNLVPDYSTRVREGGYYGWPWYYMGNHEDPRHAGERPDLAGKTITPDVPYQSHSAATGLAFYTVTEGRSAFPAEYLGDGFAVLHGSWNRAARTGHKVVRVFMDDGVPTGAYEDFLVGFVTEDGGAWGRPVSVSVASDGSLLVGDDGANVIYRISH